VKLEIPAPCRSFSTQSSVFYLYLFLVIFDHSPWAPFSVKAKLRPRFRHDQNDHDQTFELGSPQSYQYIRAWLRFLVLEEVKRIGMYAL